MHYHRYGHLSKITVKKGQQVKPGDMIGKVGGTGGWLAHLHIDCLKYQPAAWTEYVIGKTKQWVLDHYEDPRPFVGPTHPTLYDHLGYDWLELAKYASGSAYHPGLDINGPGSGNADLGQFIYANINGTVEYIYDGTGKNSGWGKLIIIKEDEMSESIYKDTISKSSKVIDFVYGDSLNEKEADEYVSEIKDLVKKIDQKDKEIQNLKTELSSVQAKSDAELQSIDTANQEQVRKLESRVRELEAGLQIAKEINEALEAHQEYKEVFDMGKIGIANYLIVKKK